MARELHIALIGNVDHGKSSLLAAISGSFSKVGKAPLVSYEQIDLATLNGNDGLKLNRAEVKVSGTDRDYVLADYPSHQDFIKSLISADRLDGILLVVSAADGPMPQTREHLRLAREMGVEKLAFVLNKADMVSPSLQEMVEKEVKALLEEEGFLKAACPTIKGSALQARKCCCGSRECEKCGFLFGILDSLEKCFPAAAAEPEKPLLFVASEAADTPFGLALVKGSLLRGRCRKDDKVTVLTSSGEVPATVKGIELDGSPAEEAAAISSPALYLEGVKPASVVKGTPLFPPGKARLGRKFRALVYVFRKEEGGKDSPVGSSGKAVFSFWGGTADGSFKLPADREAVMPGDSSLVTAELSGQFPVEKGFPFSMVEEGKNIGIGKIVEVME